MVFIILMMALVPVNIILMLTVLNQIRKAAGLGGILHGQRGITEENAQLQIFQAMV